LWRTYINYIITKYTLNGSVNNEEVIAAFECTLTAVGLDSTSGPIWIDYLRFIKGQPTNSSIEESQKMEQLRRLFQRAVVQPLQNLEVIWKDYDAYENGLNKILAKALLGDFGPKYMNARSVYRERKNMSDGIQKQMLARPSRLILNSKDSVQVKLWKKLLAYEKSNPHKLDTETLRDRVSYTFNQCLMCLYHFPEIWHEAAQFHVTNGNNFPEDAIKVYKRGVNAVKESILLALTYADFLESLGKIEKAKKMYERIMSRTDSLIYIQYIRFTRRCFDIREARKLFYQIIKMPNCTYQVYVANAELELYTNNNPKIAQHIFDMGFKIFNNSTNFLLLYVDFLFRLHDNVNIRTLFEKVLNQITSDKAQEVWNAYHKYEKLCGTLQNLETLEKRKSEAYQANSDSMVNLVQRYRYLDLWPCSADDLVNFETINTKKNQLSQVTGGLSITNKDDRANLLSGFNIKRINKEKMAKPDFSKLVLFNPESQNKNFSIGNGESISLPSTLLQFINAVSKPIGSKTWEGARIDIPSLMNMIAEKDLKDPRDTDQSVIGRKRKIDDHEGTSKIVTDIYRDRQASKVQRTNDGGMRDGFRK
jgi:cleavage stimulation factor subunit 3